MTFVGAIADNDNFRDTLESIGRVFEGDGGGLFAVVPGELFDDGQLPDVDLEAVSVASDGEDDRQLAVPYYRPRSLRGGVHIITREHIAAAWYDMSPAALEWEYTHRLEEDRPIPPFLEDAVDAGGDEA